MDSIITENPEVCFLCGRRATEMHHIYFGNPGRKNSEKFGLKVPLCADCHRNPRFGVHFDKDTDDELKKIGQIAFQRTYPEQNFRDIFGKNYI